MQINLKVAPAARVTAMISLGCPIVFTGLPAPSTTYPIDQETLSTLGTVARDVASGFGLPTGTLTYPVTDLAGARHALTGAQISKLYVRLRDYRRAMALYALGLTTTLPAPPAVI